MEISRNNRHADLVHLLPVQSPREQLSSFFFFKDVANSYLDQTHRLLIKVIFFKGLDLLFIYLLFPPTENINIKYHYF